MMVLQSMSSFSHVTVFSFLCSVSMKKATLAMQTVFDFIWDKILSGRILSWQVTIKIKFILQIKTPTLATSQL